MMSPLRLRGTGRGGRLLLLVLSLVTAAMAANRDIVVHNLSDPRPQLFFACDRQTSDLQALFTPALIDDLRQLKAGVALSTEDLSPERAQVVRMLNSAGIPMIAWIALPRDQGYYVNAGNAPETTARFEDFDRWTRSNNLHWQAVGLDIEPTLSDYGSLTGNKLRLFWVGLRRGFDSNRVSRARQAYTGLIHEMHSRGYVVETYQLPLIADERRVHTTLLERLLGIVDVRGDQEVLMLYTSFNHPIGAGILWQYGPDAQAIAVGSTATSGDTAMDAKFPPLNWDEFSRNLIVARHFSRLVGVYNLDGCVRQGFIPRLRTIDWSEPVVISAEAVGKAKRLRRLIFVLLWLAAHMIYVALLFLLMVGWLVRLIVRRRGRRLAKVRRFRTHHTTQELV